MLTISKLRELLIRGIQVNNWIMEMPIRAEGKLTEWHDIMEALSEYESTLLDITDRDEFNYLITEYENGIKIISEFIDKRLIVQRIKESIIDERVMSA